MENVNVEWRSIPASNGYEASRCGMIRNRHGRILKPQRHHCGYRIVGIKFGDRRVKSVTVHSVVALAWLGERPDGYDVHHRDGDKTNNAVENLAYVTRSTNVIEQKKMEARLGKIIAWSAMLIGETVVVPVKQCLTSVRYRAVEKSNELGKRFEFCEATRTITRTA